MPDNYSLKAVTTPEIDELTMRLSFTSEWVRGGSSVTLANVFSPTLMLCGCSNMSQSASVICEHLTELIRKAKDAPLTKNILDVGTSAVDFVLPLFVANAQEFKWGVKVTPRRMPSGLMYGQVTVTVPGESPAQKFAGSFTSTGDVVHQLGYVGPNEGRESMRAMLSAWVQAQTAMLNPSDRLECASFYHSQVLGDLNTSDPREVSSILLTSYCLSCAIASSNIPDDVPSF